MKKTIIERIAQECRVRPKSLRMGSRSTRDVIEARYAYAVALMVMGEDMRNIFVQELGMREAVAIDYEVRAEEFFRLSKKFRRLVESVTKGIDAGLFAKYATAHPAKVDQWLQILAESNPQKRAMLPGSKQGKALHSFAFTIGEEIAMQRACEEAEEYMNKYGEGVEFLPIVNRKYYF